MKGGSKYHKPAVPSFALAVWLSAAIAWAAPIADLPEELATRLQESVELLAVRQLAADHLTNKVREGLAKGMPMPRILAALEQLERHTLLAAEIAALARDAKAAPTRAPLTIAAVTDALQSGAETNRLQQLARQCQSAPDAELRLAGAATLIADLLVGGHDQQAAFALVGLALDRGFGPADLANLGGALNRLGGLDSAATLQQVFGRVQAGERPVPIDGIWSGAGGAGGAVDVRLPPAPEKRAPNSTPSPPGKR